jgi:tetratricopeptide (TPR) repeat protein
MSRPLLAGLLGILVTAPAWGGPPQDAVIANERGIAHLTARRFDPAIQSFRAARKILPEDRVVARNLAAALARKAEREMQARRPDRAIELLREARELHPGRLRYRVALARAYLGTKRDSDRLSARDQLMAVLETDPDHLDALLIMASIDYHERRLDDGFTRLQHAVSLEPDNRLVVARRDEMKRERDVENRYEALEGANFIVRFAPNEKLRARAETVLDQCLRAWSDLAGRFGHYPSGRIVVTLYPPADFRRATNLHGWVAGVSDGSIRLTVKDSTRNESLNRTIRHEIAHHIIRDLAPRTPVWLHEGLAQMAEGDSGARASRRFARGEPPKDAELDRSILSERDQTRVSRFYALSLAFTHYLQQLQGDRGIQGLLDELKRGRSLDGACQIVFGEKRAALFAAWLRSIRQR